MSLQILLISLAAAAVYDEKGGRIGNWFSLPGLNVVIRITGEHRVAISTPSPDISSAP